MPKNPAGNIELPDPFAIQEEGEGALVCPGEDLEEEPDPDDEDTEVTRAKIFIKPSST